MAFFEMAKTAMMTLLNKPATMRYPAEAAKKTSLSRGHVTIEENRCISCGSCQRICPSQAIVVEREAKTWQIDRLRCVVCRACVDVCPVTCLFMDTQYSPSMTSRGVDVVAITYVKPAKPATEKGEAKT